MMIELKEVNSRIKIGYPFHYLLAIAICHRVLVINEMGENRLRLRSSSVQTKKGKKFPICINVGRQN